MPRLLGRRPCRRPWHDSSWARPPWCIPGTLAGLSREVVPLQSCACRWITRVAYALEDVLPDEREALFGHVPRQPTPLEDEWQDGRVGGQDLGSSPPSLAYLLVLQTLHPARAQGQPSVLSSERPFVGQPRAPCAGPRATARSRPAQNRGLTAVQRQRGCSPIGCTQHRFPYLPARI